MGTRRSAIGLFFFLSLLLRGRKREDSGNEDVVTGVMDSMDSESQNWDFLLFVPTSLMTPSLKI